METAGNSAAHPRISTSSIVWLTGIRGRQQNLGDAFVCLNAPDSSIAEKVDKMNGRREKRSKEREGA